MADQQAFFDLLDIMESEKFVDPKRFFHLMRSNFAIANLIYIDAEQLPAGFGLHRVHHTFEAHHAGTGIDAAAIAPMLGVMSNCVRALDWQAIREQHAECDPLFAAVSSFGPGVEGVTVPLASPGRRLAFLGIHAVLPAAEWPAYRRCHLPDFQLLANLFHASMIENERRPPIRGTRSALTSRETEVLGWAAAGKSYWEIGAILGISERTVRFFMTNARRKLNVVSNSQAVAQAVRHDLIPTL